MEQEKSCNRPGQRGLRALCGAGHHEYMKPATVSASLAVISTASKYLHNDLARAIKALEQKNWSS